MKTTKSTATRFLLGLSLALLLCSCATVEREPLPDKGPVPIPGPSPFPEPWPNPWPNPHPWPPMPPIPPLPHPLPRH